VLLKLHREQDANPAEPSTHFLLAQAYRATGKTEETKAEMKSFSELEQQTQNTAAEGASQAIQENQNAH
jgi:hypothetical protein